MSLSYNGIDFGYCQTEHLINGPIKDPSGTDQLYTEIKLKAKSILYVDSLIARLPPGITGDVSTGQLMTRIRHMLTAPRKALYYDFISIPGTKATLPGNQILNIPDGLDDANGPWPDESGFSITLVTPKALEVTWACTVRITDCVRAGVNPIEPLSIRWEDSISWDETWKATYKRSGTVIISSRSSFSLDAFRRTGFVGMGVYPGFKRRTAEYLVSRDGLRCDFTFIDEQIRFAPPQPAVKMKLVQSESFPMTGAIRKGEVMCSLVGLQDANVSDLAGWAITIARARVWGARPISLGTVVLSDAVLKTDETEDGVSVACSFTYKAEADPSRTTSGGGSFWSRLGFNVGIGIGPATSLFGSLVGSVIGSRPPAPPTPTGADPSKAPVFPWVGYGTSPPNILKPSGYAVWADPSGTISGPADGLSLATSVRLFAAALSDPCGTEIELRSIGSLPTSSSGGIFGSGGWLSSLMTGSGTTGSSVDGALLVAATAKFKDETKPTLLTTVESDGWWRGTPLSGAVYDHWQCLSEYVESPGVMVLPTCVPDGTNIKVRTSSEVTSLRMRWAAKRMGAPPTLPPKTPPDNNWVYVGGIISPREMKVLADGVSVEYEVTGVYEFQALDSTLVKKTAQIPPFLSPSLLLQPSKWLSTDPRTEATGVPAGSGGNSQSASSQLPGVGSNNPLGGNEFPVKLPY